MATVMKIRISEPDGGHPICASEQFSLLSAPGHLLRRNDQRALEIFEKHLGAGITRQQFALLVALHQRPGSSQKDLVTASGIDKSTIKEMLSRMVVRGWVEQSRNPRDGRAWVLQLTDEGAAMTENRIAAAKEAQREILAPLSFADQSHLTSCLRAMLDLS